MKWAQTKDVLDSDGVRNKEERKKLFKEYKTKKELKKDLEDPTKFEEWVAYPNEEFKDSFELDRKAQRKYELFCGGFLYYHDVEFKKYPKGAGYEYPKKPGLAAKWKEYPDYPNSEDKKFDHDIYFEWFSKGKGNKIATDLKIHITVTPPEFNPKPPPPPPPPPPESNP